MKQVARSLVLALAACTLTGVSSAQPEISSAAHSIHRSGFHRGHSMRAMLSMSAAVVQPVAVPSVPLYNGMGKLNFTATSTSAVAQRYFLQGLAFAYGFNHAAAIASFREAQRLDPKCAMCWWGEALAHGPNINAPMDAASNARAVGVAAYADWLARNSTPAERALTAAMVKRYSLDPKAKGLVRYGYYPHNVHFIVTSAQMAGEMPTAIREARKLETILDPDITSQIAWIQALSAAPYFASAQFATPAEVLAMRAPDARLPYPTAMRFYARALAHAQQRNRTGFEQELTRLRAVGRSGALKPMIAQGAPAGDLLHLAETVARARWASANGRLSEAVRLYRQAVSIEQDIPYTEPPYWYYPVQQSLGAALYRAGRYGEARAAFQSALTQSPNNGWVLYGLAASERALGRRAQAAAADLALKKAWSGDPAWLRMDRL